MHESDGRPQAAAGGLSRREVIGRGAALGVVMYIPAAGTAVTSAVAAPAAKAALTPQQSGVLQALVGRLIPTDANGPGGVDAGAAAYIEKALGSALKSASGLYVNGLNAIDAFAAASRGAPFAALAPEVQDSVMSDVEQGSANWFSPGLDGFFRALHEHALQGMFGDPVYGGNKGFAGWDLVNYPGVRMPVPAKYQKIGVTVPKAHMSTYADGAYAKAKKEAQA